VIVRASSLELGVGVLFIEALDSVFLLLGAHFLIAADLAGILSLVQLVLEGVDELLVLVHFGLLGENFLGEVGDAFEFAACTSSEHVFVLDFKHHHGTVF